VDRRPRVTDDEALRGERFAAQLVGTFGVVEAKLGPAGRPPCAFLRDFGRLASCKRRLHRLECPAAGLALCPHLRVRVELAAEILTCLGEPFTARGPDRFSRRCLLVTEGFERGNRLVALGHEDAVVVVELDLRCRRRLLHCSTLLLSFRNATRTPCRLRCAPAPEGTDATGTQRPGSKRTA
jgi:hypothetical protein